MNRPTRNGSSNTTIEVLIALSVLGSSALTLFALALRDEPKSVEASRDDEGQSDD